MVAAKGNKYALGNNGGRPRVHDREKLAQELIEWAMLPDSINMNGFCISRDPLIAPSAVLDLSRSDQEFGRAYELAKACIAKRREEKLNANELHVKAFDMNARVYDTFLRDEHRNQLEFESKLKAQEQTAVTDHDIARHESLMEKLHSLQSERKIEDSNNKAAHKS